MDLPQELITDIRNMAVSSIREFSESVQVGYVKDDGEKQESVAPLLILTLETIRVTAARLKFIESDMSNELVIERLDDMCKMALKSLPEMLEKIEKAIAEGFDDEDQDPVDIVEAAIKEAQKHA